jgi:hypothetical protein
MSEIVGIQRCHYDASDCMFTRYKDFPMFNIAFPMHFFTLRSTLIAFRYNFLEIKWLQQKFDSRRTTNLHIICLLQRNLMHVGRWPDRPEPYWLAVGPRKPKPPSRIRAQRPRRCLISHVESLKNEFLYA